MAERATISQIVQVGVETTSGTPIAASKKMQSVGFTLSPQFETRTVRPSGAKYPTIAILGKDWTQVGIAGDASYEDLWHLFSSVLTNQTEAAASLVHTFTPSVTGADAPKTLTIEKGEVGGEAERVAGVAVNELTLNFTRDATEVTGTGFGKETQFNASMTAGATALALTPVLPTDTCVYWNTTSATIGTTKLLRVLSASWSITNRFTPLWVLDCAIDSYVAVIEAVPEITASLVLEADNQANAFVDTHLRPGVKGYLAIKADRPAGPPNYALAINTACAVTSTGELGDQDGVYALTVNLTGVTDGAWTPPTGGQVCNVVLTNNQATTGF